MSDLAIKVDHVTKSFRIPHEKVNTARGAFASLISRQRGYETFQALNDVSFEIKKGEFFGIIGRNGCGKSTLLKTLAGIYVPDAGTIQINGQISPFLELGIGFNPDLSGRDNVYLNGAILGLSRQEITAKYNDIVAFSELERFMDQKLKNYSSGMQVRLAFSVAIHANKDILIMDEVLAVGDNNFQAKCFEVFSNYKSQGKTVVLVTHDINAVQKYCDRALLLRNGEITCIGTAEDVGNEYFQQNILDRELIMSDLAVDLDHHDNRPTMPYITNVEILNKDLEKKNVFETGEQFFVKICFDRANFKEPLNIGVGLWSAEGVNIFSYNTQMDGKPIPNEANSIMLNLPKLHLLKGGYYINVVCFSEIEQGRFDFKERCKAFEVFTTGLKNNYRGFLDNEHEWEIKPH